VCRARHRRRGLLPLRARPHRQPSEIGDIAARYDVSAPQLCIRYLLQKGAVVLPKATKTPHIQQNAELDFEISAADMSVLDGMRHTEKHEDAREFRWK
jgi:diketogulonate reductase-like aldo/keto reductase